MICQRCIHRASQRSLARPLTRTFTTTPHASLPAAAPTSTSSPRPNFPSAISTSAAQPFSAPLSPTPNDISLGTSLRPASKGRAAVIPVSSAPAGTPLKGLNFNKGREDPVAKAEEEYPEWLWRCLEAKEEGAGVAGDGEAGDEYCESRFYFVRSY